MPRGLTPLGGLAYLAADGGDGLELWSTNGTDLGTVQIAAIDPNPAGGPRSLRVVGGSLFFTISDGIHGRELWRYVP